MQNSAFKAKRLTIFIALMMLLSILGGYELSHLVYGMNGDYQQRTKKLLAMERNLGDATASLGRQIEEWKDMLLRNNDAELYKKHKLAFFESGRKVQEALMRTKSAMQDDGMNTAEVEQLLLEHQSLSSDYLFAKFALKSGNNNSYLETDKLVIGIDRSLQQHIANVRSHIERFTELQLKKPIPTQWNRYLIVLLGALSLLGMALIGFLFARRF